MAQTKRKNEWDANRVPAVSGNVERAIPTPSPARALQQMLDERTAVADDVVRWSRRRSLAFTVTVASALWLALLELANNAAMLVA